MKVQSKIAVILVAVFAVAIGALYAVNRDSGGPEAIVSKEQQTNLLPDDRRVVGEEGSSSVTLVEFLDFECEACGAFYPIVEDLRVKYAGKVTFVARYFPLPSHFNSMRAARAVESAARQDQFEAMYEQMFETQKMWAESQEPADETFRQFAMELGLDMEQFDADYKDPAVQQRVQNDVDDGVKLGVNSTPTFYLNGELLEPRSLSDFTSAIDAALAK